MITILKFGASWCAPCKQIQKTLNQIKEEYSNITVKNIDIDEEAELTIKYNIRNIPTLIIQKEGEKDKKLIGTQTKEQILELCQ